MRYFLSICMIACFSGEIFSQDLDSLLIKLNDKDLKVGLVLSGGGAKGLAYIGVLKILEEEGVRIDYIGGTSMGAMIGGLYAAGYTARQLDSIYRETDFEEIIRDNLPRRVKSFYDRESEDKYALSFPFQGMKIGIPVAFTKGQNIYDLFNRLLYDYRFTTDFNELPIPFLCIAADIETGQQVVFNKGNLAQAIVASGSLPTLFTPFEVDGKYLTDGGIVNNYPIDEVRKMGADIIIGVDVQADLSNRDDINSMAKVVMQIINFQMLRTMEDKKNATDIYIKPDVSEYNTVSFNEASKIVKKGEIAAQQFREQFREIAKLQKDLPKTKKTKNPLLMHKISDIDIEGVENYSRAYVLGKLQFKQNQTISCDDFKEGFNRLNATQNFSSITYKFEKNEDGGDNLIINLKENNVKTLIRFGLHYDELYKSGLLINLTHKNLFTRNDVISGDFIFGDNMRYNLNYYIDNGFYWSFGVRSKLNQLKTDVPVNYLEFIPIITGLENIRLNYYNIVNQAYFQTILSQFLAGIGLEHQMIDMQSKTVTIGDKPFNEVYKTSNFLGAYGYFTLDTYDKKHFPKNGVYINGNFKWTLNSNILGDNFGKYSTGHFSVAHTKTFFDKLSLSVSSSAGFTLGRTTGVSNFLIGGYGYNPIDRFEHFYGYDFLNLTANSYIKGASGIDYEIFKKNHLNFFANFANIGNKIFDQFDAWFSKPTYSGYAFGYGLETIIGPIELKYSWSPETRENFWWVSIGFWF